MNFFISKRFFSCGAVDRAVRELPWESRFTILRERKKPQYFSESIGTPRRELTKNLINGIRIHPTFNPHVKFNNEKRYQYDNWNSRNFEDWDATKCFVRGSRRRYEIPSDILPCKDELGEMHPPRLSGRYRADVEKQYYINGLPWIWDKDFYSGKIHFHDNQPIGPKLWYRKEFRKERIKEAMKRMDDMVLNYRKESRERKNLSWMDRVIFDVAGDEIASNFIKKPKMPLL